MFDSLVITDPATALGTATSSLNTVMTGFGTFFKSGVGIMITLAVLSLLVGFIWRVSGKAKHIV